MEKINLVSNIHHVDACLRVESNALVFTMGPAVKNIVGMIFLILGFTPPSPLFNYISIVYC